MLIFDQLKKNDPHLRLLAIGIGGGLVVLLAGLWWLQIVSSRDYKANLETQSIRTVRLPAIRGKIFDRNGIPLAENRPAFKVSLFLEELSKSFEEAAGQEITRVRNDLRRQMAAQEKKLNRSLTSKEQKYYTLNTQDRERLRAVARFNVASNVVQRISRQLQCAATLDFTNFQRHYRSSLYVPYPVALNINGNQIARFQEQFANMVGVDMEIQPVRVYPNQTAAAHLLGYLTYNDDSLEGEEAFFSYRMPEYRGALGVERGLDISLHGRAGSKSVVVNSRGYRQNENVWTPAEAGSNVFLSIDLPIQQATEHALQNAPVNSPHGAAVVMDVNTGDILAMASVPTYNPNYFMQGFPPGEYQRVQESGAEHNRATQENYMPGSIFKLVVALACLENGLDPKATYEVRPNPRNTARGIIYVGRRAIKDTAPPGPYDFERALIHSSNSYFITNGIHVAGVDKIVELGKRLHLGESFSLGTRQETRGNFPDRNQIRSGWSASATANLCIGQGYIDVTPVQMAVLAAAMANGGKVLWPRLVDRIESQDPLSTDPPVVLPKGRIRDQLGVSQRSLQIVRNAMVKDVEDPDGTGTRAFIPGFRICAKTGTAQIENPQGEVIDSTTWFLSFAPYENPRYAVVVMIEHGVSGGVTCAPVAKEIYQAILRTERTRAVKTGTLAQTN